MKRSKTRAPARRRRESALARTERLARVGSWQADLPGKRFFFSEEALRIHGLAPGGFGGGTAEALGLVHPDDRARVLAALKAAIERAEPFEVDFRVVRADGAVRHMHAKGDVLRDGDGAPARVFGITQDITEGKHTERALQEEQQRLALVTENVPAMIAYIDAGQRFRYANLRYREFYAGSAASIDGRTIGKVLTPQAWEAARPYVERALSGEAVSYEGERRLHDGRRRYISASLVPHRAAGGAVLGVYILAMDITAQHEAQNALREREERFRALTELSSDYYWEQDENLRFTERSAAAWERRGGAAQSVLGKTRWELPALNLTEADWRAHRAELAARREFRELEIERPAAGGKTRWISTSGRPIFDSNGRFRGYRGVGRDITERKLAEAALRESEAGLRHAQQMASLAYLVVSADGRYERWSENWPGLLGLEDARLPKTTRESLELVHPEDRGRFRDMAIRAGRSRQRTVLEYRFRRGDGALVHLLQTMEPLGAPDAAGGVRWFVTMQDITARKLAEQRIQRLNRVYAVLSGINGAIVRIRDEQELFQEVCRIGVELGGFRFVWLARVDAAGGRLVPVASAGEAGDFLERIRDRLSLRDDAPSGLGAAAVAAREGRAVFVNDVQASPLILLKDLHRALDIRAVGVLPIMLEGRPVAALALHAAEAGFFDEQEQRLLLELAGDIAFALDHIDKEVRVRYLAYYDALTGLANRSLLLERLGEQVAAARARSESLALVMVNVERFKNVNDTLGRQAGDELLRQIARRLSAAAGGDSRVARVGADEFAVVLPQVGSQEDLAQRLRRGNARVTREPFAVGGRELRVSFRSGVAMFPADGADAESLFRNAEAALRKARSGELFVFYAQGMTEAIAEKLELENRLRLAVERREFVLHYQAKLDLATRRVTGAEALIRWQSPELGLVPPARFIPMLEETGLIGEVGAWALAQAVEDQQRWRSAGRAAPRISVNVSAAELRRPDFVATVRAALARGAAPAIDLEITESLLMDEVESSVAKLRALRGLGVGVAIDDFGTGYSSLGYLARLPVQALKIDRSFIITMLADQNAMTLVSTIVSLAHGLRLKVIAEGVDSEEQAKALYLLRCDEVQGYLFARPVPAADFEATLG